MKPSTCLTLGALLAFAATLVAEDQQYATPPDIEEVLTIQDVRIDGSLNLSFDLGRWLIGVRDGIPINLVHQIRTDIAGHPYSEMAITGLTACIVPAESVGQRCLVPGEGEAIVNLANVGAEYSPVGEGLRAHRPRDGDLEILTRSGVRWVFENGIPVSGTGAYNLGITVETQGAKITRILATRLNRPTGELRAQYDSLGYVREIRFGARVHRFRYDGERHLLSEWVSSGIEKEIKTTFEYENDLLVRVRNSGALIKELQWQRIPDGETADTEWPAPVRVSGNGKTRYKYTLDYKGFSLTGKSLETGVQQRVVLNTLRGQIRVSETGKPDVVMKFGTRRGNPTAGKVTRIEDAKGDVLAQFEYDDSGKVVRK